MNCYYDLYSVFWLNRETLGIIAILELLFLVYLGFLMRKKKQTLTNLKWFIVPMLLFVPIIEVFGFCYPVVVAVGRTLLLIALVSLGFWIGGKFYGKRIRKDLEENL